MNSIEADGSFFEKNGAMLPKVMKRFWGENNLPDEHDGKGMNIV
jgi:hypothetical protein